MRQILFLVFTLTFYISVYSQGFKNSGGVFYQGIFAGYFNSYAGLEFNEHSALGTSCFGGGLSVNIDYDFGALLVSQQYGQFLPSLNKTNSLKAILGLGLQQTSFLGNFNTTSFQLLAQLGLQIKLKDEPLLFYSTLNPIYSFSNFSFFNSSQFRLGLNYIFGETKKSKEEGTNYTVRKSNNGKLIKKGNYDNYSEDENSPNNTENESDLPWTKDSPANEKTDVFNISDGDLVKDIDGNIYKTMILGEKRWFAENLKVSRYNNGEVINEIESDNMWSEVENDAWSKYNNSDEYERIVGRLYNGYVIIDDRQVCPTGWHIPSNDEWVELINDLGGAKRAIPKLKSVNGWLGSFKNSNSSGLKGYPSGARKSDGLFDGAGKLLVWWSSTSNEDKTKLYCRFITHDKQDFFRSSVDLNNGFAIRCKED
jgi:uncharacterized protein (TIGR02145 family)